MNQTETSVVVHGSPDPEYTGPRRSLLLSGGGMRVAYQAGAVRALIESGYVFDHMDGTSGGSMNVGMLLSGRSPEEMWDRWRTLEVSSFVSLLPLRDYLDGIESMGDADGIKQEVFPHLGIDLDRIGRAEGVEGTFNLCNYHRKTNEVVSHRKITRDLLVAGMSLPIVLPAVEHDGVLYTDSAWIRDTNLWEAVKRGAEELWLVWCLGNSTDYKPGFFHQYVHMLEMSANGSLFEEFDRIRDLNDRILNGDSPYGQRRPVRLHVISPRYPLPLDPDLYLGNITTQTLLSMGYRDAVDYLATMDPDGLAYEPEVTHMTNARPGITFKETMKGGFSLQETDPDRGKRAGERAGTELAMHATVHIEDIDRFAEDPDHEGHLTGTIDFDPIGTEMSATHGVFKLFAPGDYPDMNWMIYELAFEHEGRRYYLAGKKEVRNDPGFDLWSDTTTLYTKLHEGSDTSGPVVGAGVLTLGVEDLIKLVSTMRATHASSMEEKAHAFSTFGKMFMGELWDSYAEHVPGN